MAAPCVVDGVLFRPCARRRTLLAEHHARLERDAGRVHAHIPTFLPLPPPPRMAGSAWPPACWQASRRGGARRARKSPMTIVPLSVGACSFWYRLLRPCSTYALPSIGVPGSISAPSTGGFFFCRPYAPTPLRRSRGGYNTACEKLTWHSAARGHSVRFGQACSRTRHCLGQHD